MDPGRTGGAVACLSTDGECHRDRTLRAQPLIGVRHCRAVQEADRDHISAQITDHRGTNGVACLRGRRSDARRSTLSGNQGTVSRADRTILHAGDAPSLSAALTDRHVGQGHRHGSDPARKGNAAKQRRHAISQGLEHPCRQSTDSCSSRTDSLKNARCRRDAIGAACEGRGHRGPPEQWRTPRLPCRDAARGIYQEAAR